MFINRGNYNNLLHYQNLNDSVAFKIIKYILLMTSVILLLIYVVLYVVFMLFASKFIEEFQAEAKQLQRENIVAEAKLGVSIAFVGILCLQSALIYAIYRELYRVTFFFALFSLVIAFSFLISQGIFFSIGHCLIALLHSILLFYYAWRIKQIRARDVLYIAGRGGPQDVLMYSNYGAPPLGYGKPSYSSRHNPATRLQPVEMGAYPAQYGYAAPVPAYGAANPTAAAGYYNKMLPGQMATGQFAPSALAQQPGYIGGQYPNVVNQPQFAGIPQQQQYAVNAYQQMNPPPVAAPYQQLNASLPTSATTNYQQSTSGNIYQHHPTMLNAGNAATSAYQQVGSSQIYQTPERLAGAVYGGRALTRQTPQFMVNAPGQRAYYDSTYPGVGASSATAAAHHLTCGGLGGGSAAGGRNWNVNINPTDDYRQPILSASAAGYGPSRTTVDAQYMGRPEVDRIYGTTNGQASHSPMVSKRPNVYSRNYI